MNKKLKVFLVISSVLIVILVVGISPTNALVLSTSQNKAETFTANVLPMNEAQYNVTLSGYHISSYPDVPNGNVGINKTERITYSFTSPQSILSVGYVFENDFLTTCVVTVLKGQVSADHSYTNLNDAVLDFLERYQSFKGVDTSDMRYMVANNNILKNQTFLLGDLELRVTNGDYPFSGHETSLIWYRIINGCEYLQLSLGFADGVFTGFRDIRDLFPLGNTEVNISKEQAINMAMKYVKENYTYEMPGKILISDFNIVENKTSAVLSPTWRNSNTQYPAWNVMLALDHTYPGSVIALVVLVSANSGEILLCSNQAVGGSTLPNNENANVILSPSPSPLLLSPSTTSMPNKVSSNNNFEVTLTAIVAIIVAFALIICLRLKTIRKTEKVYNKSA